MNRITFFVCIYIIFLSPLAFSKKKLSEPAAPVPVVEVGPQLLTRTVAQVGNHVITSREVQIVGVLEDLLYEPEEAKSAQNLDFNLTPSRVSALILEWMLFFEAESFSVGNPSEELLGQQAKKVEQRLGANTKWLKLEVSKAELETVLKRKATAKNIMKVKTEFSGISVTDADAQEFFDKNKAKFGNVTFQTFKDNIKSYLLQQAMQERMKDWIEVLKRKYRVRVMESN